MGFPPGYIIPSGHVPGAETSSTGDPFGLKVGLVTRVDEMSMKCDIKILTGGGYRFEVDLTQAMAGPRSFWGGIPEVNSLVLIGYRRKHKQIFEAVILGYIPTGQRSGLRFDPFSQLDPGEVSAAEALSFSDLIGKTTRYKRLMMHPGDVGGMSSSGAELVLAKDIRMTNRAGDLFELRDADRTIVAQSVHRVEAEAGVHRFSGPIRRSTFWLPPDILGTGAKAHLLKTVAERYFGRDDLQASGPGPIGAPSKFANSAGKILDAFNSADEFPPVTYSNGKRTFYPASVAAENFETIDSAAEPYTEYRLEMHHTTDTSMDVLDEIDGFTMQPRVKYIEHVLGTIVGNDAHSGMGQRQYARILKPKIFDSFDQTTPGKFSLEEVSRSPLSPDLEVDTTAGAYLFRITPPRGVDGDHPFGVAVSKQGKLFVQLPGSRVESYSDGATQNVSAEITTQGGVKAHFGASSPDKVSLHATFEGGVILDVGSNSDGQAITVRYHSSYVAEYLGVPDVNDVAYSATITGNSETLCTADVIENVQGAKATTVNGGYTLMADRVATQAQSGYTLNAGESNVLVSGKSQYNYAMQVLENVVTGGKVSTVLAGGVIQTVLAGTHITNVLGGATSVNSAAGAYTVTVGVGGISMSAAAGAVSVTAVAGAVSIAAAAGAVAITAGLAMNLTAGLAISLLSPQVLVGGPAAVLGVCRGVPMMPPGTPSLDWILAIPLQGSAMFRSIL